MIDEGLQRLGLSSNPFRPFRPDEENLDRITVGREEELGTLRTIAEFYATMNTRKNAVLVGESGVGKSTILFNLINSMDDLGLNVVFHPFFPTLQDLVDSIAEALGVSSATGSAREIGDRFLEFGQKYPETRRTLVLLDNAEDFLGYEEKEEYIRIFKRSHPLFILAGTTEEWNELVRMHPMLTGVFTQLRIEPFDLAESKKLIRRRLSLAQIDSDGFAPFTEMAAETVSVYSLFIPGKVVDLASRMIIEAIMEEHTGIPDEFVREYLYESTPFSEYYGQLSDRQVQILEEIVKNEGEASFKDLSSSIGISRVAIADHIQRLIDVGLVAHVDKPGKKKYFDLTPKLGTLI